MNEAIRLADKIHEQEKLLIQLLRPIDAKKFYVRYGFNSLRGFCQVGLQFSKTQAQRIATQVRRSEPTVNFMDERGSSS